MDEVGQMVRDALGGWLQGRSSRGGHGRLALLPGLWLWADLSTILVRGNSGSARQRWLFRGARLWRLTTSLLIVSYLERSSSKMLSYMPSLVTGTARNS
jgi:hypothetical protein